MKTINKQENQLLSKTLNRSTNSQFTTLSKGFTIVELLVVIVVIGILTIIAVVSYSGITNRAVSSVLQSDLNNARKQLKLYQALYGSFPTALDANYCPTAPNVDTNYCLKISSSTLFSNYHSDNSSQPQIFALTMKDANETVYRITDDSTPVVGNNSRTSCLDIQNANESTGSGIYWIKPLSGPETQVYCDMVNDGGGWTKIYEGLVTSSTSISRTTGNVVELSNNITFNNMKIQAKNWNYSITATTTETAMLMQPFSWYFEWLHDEPDLPNPYAKFHGLDGIQDVQFTILNRIMYGYGNSWRNLTAAQYNTQDATEFLYLGGVHASIRKLEWGYGDYNQHMNDESPAESGLGLTPRQFQEIYIWVK